MKIVLSTLNAKYIHSSLALPYLKLYCENDAWQIETLEFTINQPLDDIRTRLYLSQPDVLSFSCYIWNIEPTLTLCRDLKQLLPQCIIILGGPEVSFDASEVLSMNESIQIIIRGEGENSLKEVLHSLQNGYALADIKGITYRNENRGIVQNPDRELIKDLNLLPSPYQCDLSGYQDRLVYYESSRGCPFNCSYCLSSTFKGVRTFSLERVKTDLGRLIENGTKTVKFVDRTFNSNEKRAMAIMEYIINQNASTRFHFEICADLISDEFLHFLLQAPSETFLFEIGVQSTFPPALEAVNRCCDLERFASNVRQLSERGNIHLHLDLIAGLPFERYSNFRDSFNGVYNLHPDVIQLGFLKMLKGSSLRESAGQHGYIYQEQPPYMVLSSRYMKYDKFILLSNIEKLVDRYHNSGEFQYSLTFINKHLYNEDAFTFFENLAFYSDEIGWFQQGHNRPDEYNMLMQFVENRHPGHQGIINEYLKYDFILNNRHNPLPDKIQPCCQEQAQIKLYELLKNPQFIHDNLPEWSHLSKYELSKRIQLAYFAVDPTNTNPEEADKTALLFVYPHNRRRADRIVLIQSS